MNEYGPRSNVSIVVPAKDILQTDARLVPGRFHVGGFGLTHVVEANAGHGVVYLGFRTDGQRGDQPFAVKVNNLDVRHLYDREGRHHEEVTGLPNVVPLEEYGSGILPDGQQRQYLITHYRDGGTIGDRISRGRLKLAQVANLTRGMAEGLRGIHRRGLIHRDVKPSNVLINKANGHETAEIADLGASVYQSIRTAKRIERPWSAPESFHGGLITPAADVYSLALVTASMLLQAELNGLPKNLRLTPTSVHTHMLTKTNGLQDVARGAFVGPVQKALSLNPDTRPDPGTFAQEIEDRFRQVVAEGHKDRRTFGFRRTIRRLLYF